MSLKTKLLSKETEHITKRVQRWHSPLQRELCSSPLRLYAFGSVNYCFLRGIFGKDIERLRGTIYVDKRCILEIPVHFFFIITKAQFPWVSLWKISNYRAALSCLGKPSRPHVWVLLQRPSSISALVDNRSPSKNTNNSLTIGETPVRHKGGQENGTHFVQTKDKQASNETVSDFVKAHVSR